MNVGKACAIFRHITEDRYTDAEKIEAIRVVLDMETHNSITKRDFMYALAWLWNFTDRKTFNGNVQAKIYFMGKCPYTDKKCEDWRCQDCEVEAAERKYMENNSEE